MGVFYSLPTGEAGEHDLQIRFDNQAGVELRDAFLPSEWHRQSGVQLTWPHADTDWAYMLSEVEQCYACLAREIAQREVLIVATPQPDDVRRQLEQAGVNMQNVRIYRCPSNDTWARDHGAITMIEEGRPVLLDFTFNGWGLKFASDRDNQITRRLIEQGALHGQYSNKLNFVLEGGSIESDGAGTLLTTSECLLSPNRNAYMDRTQIESYLKSTFHVQQVLWLDHGYLAGDDTDSHIDTLARLCPHDTIAYVECTDTADEHYEALQAMKEQLATFRTLGGKPYRLIALPMADCIIEDGERLPATYANFLIMNDAVLYPTYAQPDNDRKAAEALREAFPGRQIVGIDCRALIRQHGSLHCVTMQYPVGVIGESRP
jgi:agmatine/peptidylarginine deiminase